MKDFNHNCQLKLEDDILTTTWKEKKYFSYFCKKFFLISSNVNHRRVFELSQYGVERERRRHIKIYPYVIHPFSAFRYYWELIMIHAFIMRIFFMSFRILRKEKFKVLNNLHDKFNDYANVAYFIDFTLNFVTGIFDSEKCEVILKPSKYLKRYVLSFAVTDFISCVPLEYIHNFIYVKELVLTRVMYAVLKFCYIFRFINYLSRIREKKEYALHKFQIWQTLSLYVLAISYGISFIGIAKVVDDNITFDQIQYKDCLIGSIDMTFGLLQFPLLVNENELLVHVIGRITGIILEIIFVAQLITNFSCKNEPTINYSTHIKEVIEYMHFKKLPPALKRKILAFQDWYYEQKYYKIDEILSMISSEMTPYTMYNILKPILQKSIFSICTEDILLMLMGYVDKQIYLPDDILFQANTLNDLLFIVYIGSTQLICEDKYNVAVLHEGKIFVDVIPEFVENNNNQRRYTVKAKEYVVICTLKLEYLFDVLSEYPDIQNKIINELKRKTLVILNSPTHYLDLKEYYKTIPFETF